MRPSKSRKDAQFFHRQFEVWSDGRFELGICLATDPDIGNYKISDDAIQPEKWKASCRLRVPTEAACVTSTRRGSTGEPVASERQFPSVVVEE